MRVEFLKSVRMASVLVALAVFPGGRARPRGRELADRTVAHPDRLRHRRCRLSRTEGRFHRFEGRISVNLTILTEALWSFTCSRSPSTWVRRSLATTIRSAAFLDSADHP